MQKRFSRLGIAVLAVSGLTLGPALAAHATPWDGNDIYFGNGKWDPSSDDFSMDDVRVIDPANDSTPTYNMYTDIWDTAAAFRVSLDDWSTYDSAGADDDSDVDVTDDSATGDKLLTAPMDNVGQVWTDTFEISGEIRIYATSDLIRQTMFVKNITAAPVTASFEFLTDWGSGGSLWNYQGQDDTILAVPAAEDAASATAITAAGVQWVVHSDQPVGGTGDDCDAPGGVAWGLNTADHPAEIALDSGEYFGQYDDVVVPAGATIAFVVFHNWTPALLIDGNYDSNNCTELELAGYADAATAAAAEFDTFSGRLITGLSGYNVVNWGDLSTTPELPDTGLDTMATAALGFAGALALLVGGLVVVRRRRTSH